MKNKLSYFYDCSACHKARNKKWIYEHDFCSSCPHYNSILRISELLKLSEDEQIEYFCSCSYKTKKAIIDYSEYLFYYKDKLKNYFNINKKDLKKLFRTIEERSGCYVAIRIPPTCKKSWKT